jgi:hypothetical protein
MNALTNEELQGQSLELLPDRAAMLVIVVKVKLRLRLGIFIGIF